MSGTSALYNTYTQPTRPSYNPSNAPPVSSGSDTYTPISAPSVIPQNMQPGDLPANMGYTLGPPSVTNFYRPNYGYGSFNPYLNYSYSGLMNSFGRPNYFNNMAFGMSMLPSYNIPFTGSWANYPTSSTTSPISPSLSSFVNDYYDRRG